MIASKAGIRRLFNYRLRRLRGSCRGILNVSESNKYPTSMVEQSSRVSTLATASVRQLQTTSIKNCTSMKLTSGD